APTAPPRASARSSIMAKFSGPLSPLPPETMMLASVSSSFWPPAAWMAVTRARICSGESSGANLTTSAPRRVSGEARGKTLGRKALSRIGTEQFMLRVNNLVGAVMRQIYRGAVAADVERGYGFRQRVRQPARGRKRLERRLLYHALSLFDKYQNPLGHLISVK